MNLERECVEHDLAYALGGTQEDKDRADRRLRLRVYKKLRKKGYASFASNLLWYGVRIGGRRYFNFKVTL